MFAQRSMNFLRMVAPSDCALPLAKGSSAWHAAPLDQYNASDVLCLPVWGRIIRERNR